MCLCVRRRVGGANKWNLPSWSPICRIVADTIADIFPVSVSVRCDYPLSTDSFPTPIGTSYTKYSNRGCNPGNELGIYRGRSLAECQALCQRWPTCISYEYRPSESKCQMSTMCTHAFRSQPDPGWFLYVKNNVGFMDQCLKFEEMGVDMKAACSTVSCLDCTVYNGCCVSLHQIIPPLHNHPW